MNKVSDGLVSVVIPAYNVEKYLKQCVNSVSMQTYSNIEIIIVEDGATDSTAIIADECAAIDNRIRVIHKQNYGVSAARNSGIEKAIGEYIVFVDADDYLAKDYIEYMLELAKQSDAEFCISQNCFTKTGEKQIQNDNIQNMKPEDAIALLLSPLVIVGCWNKIYKTDFLRKNHLHFLTTLFYGEGLLFIIQSAQKANLVTVGKRKVYYYRRDNEVSATSKFSIQKLINGDKALREIKSNLTVSSDKILTMWQLHMCMFCLGAVTKIQENNVKQMYDNEYCYWLRYLRQHYPQIVKSTDVSMYRKLMLLGGCISPKVMSRLDVARKKRIVSSSV